jgi:hypothetical protein
MYGMEKWGISPEEIKLVEYNLLANQSAEFHVSEEEIADTKSYIKGSIADMESLLVDVENNLPKNEQFFRKVEGGKTRQRCNFRKVCEAGSPE